MGWTIHERITMLFDIFIRLSELYEMKKLLYAKIATLISVKLIHEVFIRMGLQQVYMITGSKN